jgi:ElaB/YqjD/DUF883 family membrane-anchored ribosome-binding protein
MIFIRQYLNLIIGGIIAILIVLLLLQQYRVNSLKADIAVCENKNAILNQSIETQNSAIKKQGEDAEKQLQETRQALEQAKKNTKVRTVKINALNGLKTNPPTSCDSAVKQVQDLL